MSHPVYFNRAQFMSQWYSLFPQCAVYVLRVQFYVQFMSRVQFMSLYYSLCPNSTVYVPREQFLSELNSFSLCRVQFMSKSTMSSRYSLCPQCVQFMSWSTMSPIVHCTVYFLNVQFMSLSLEYSLCPNSTVYVPRVQFISSENSLCPYIIVYVQRVQFMSQCTVYVLKSTVYVPSLVQFMSSRVQFMSFENSLQFMSFKSTVYVHI